MQLSRCMTDQSVCWFTAIESTTRDHRFNRCRENPGLHLSKTSRGSLSQTNSFVKVNTILNYYWSWAAMLSSTISQGGFWVDLWFRESLFRLQRCLQWRQSAGKSICNQECHISIRETPGGLLSCPCFPLFPSSFLLGPGFLCMNTVWWMMYHLSGRQIITFIFLRLIPSAGLCFPVSTAH